MPLRATRLKLPSLDAKGIPLRELIAVHRQFRPRHHLPNNLGDGFLLLTNPVFRRVREEFLRRKFSFSLKKHALYHSFPLMSLDDVIAAGTLPYRENFPWLEILEERAPGTFTLTELKRSELSYNYLFHESAHFVAHHHFFGKKKLAKLPKNKNTLLAIMLGEAFANTVEALSFAFAEGEIGTYFLDANCHFRANAKEAAALRRGIAQVGIVPVAKTLLASFLYSNYLYEKLSPKELRRISAFSGVKGNISPLVKIGRELSLEFRLNTTQLHLLKSGFRPPLKELRIDPVAALLKMPSLRKRAETLAEILQ